MRHWLLIALMLQQKFQSTHPLRDATVESCLLLISAKFQSTHPLRDATSNIGPFLIGEFNFNPRTPYGMRHNFSSDTLSASSISIHAPLTGCDLINHVFIFMFNISIHAPLTGCDCFRSNKIIFNDISIHAPLTGCD